MPNDAGDALGLLDALASTYAAALRPAMTIGSIEPTPALGFLDRSNRADAVLHTLRYFARRHATTIDLLYPEDLGIGEGPRQGVNLRALPDITPDDVLSAIHRASPAMVVLPRPFLETEETEDDEHYLQHSLGRTLDIVMRNVTCPILLVEPLMALNRPLCRNIMLVTPDSLELTRPLSLALTLLESEGSLLLHHVIDTRVGERRRELLARAREIDTATGMAALERAGRLRVEQCLNEVKAQRLSKGAAITTQVAVGDPVDLTLRRINAGDIDLVVVGASRERADQLGGMAYNLARLVTTTPVLVV